jgi:hypothetical protein
MPPKTQPSIAELQERIASASTELAGAEHDLRVAMEVIPVALRSEKRIIGETLQAALAKVAAAKGKLAGALADQPTGGGSAGPAREPPRRS